MIINKKELEKKIKEYEKLEEKIKNKKNKKFKFVTSPADAGPISSSSSSNTYICGADNDWMTPPPPLGYIDPADVLPN